MEKNLLQKKEVDLDKIRNEILTQVETAKKSPIKEELVSELLEEYIGYVQTPPQDARDIERMGQVETWLEDATILTKDLFEFRVALEGLGLDKEGVTYFLDHENTHANKASALKASHYGYRIIVGFDEAAKEYALHVSTVHGLPKHWSEWRRNRVNQAILKAPEEYGGEMSPDDIEDILKLQTIKESLKKKSHDH